ncbi:MAG TPA: ABC transporter permease [Chloroflexota bacterium]
MELETAQADLIAAPPVAPGLIQTHPGRMRFRQLGGALLNNPLALLGFVLFTLIVVAAVFAPLLTPYTPSDMVGPLGQGPSSTHYFGTNDTGQDIFSQIIFGARFSLAVGILTGFAITIVATIVGMTAGYVGGWIDDLLGMTMNIFLVMPQLPLLVVIAAYVPFRSDNALGTIFTMVVVITITGWAWGARVIRSQTLTLRSRDFVQSAIVAGEPTWRITSREVMPNMMGLVINTIIMSSMGAILTEAALDYLGIGNINLITWGVMLNKAQASSALFSGEWWVFIFPGLAIAVTTMSLVLMNNAVDAVGNPRLRGLKRRRFRLPAPFRKLDKTEVAS